VLCKIAFSSISSASFQRDKSRSDEHSSENALNSKIFKSISTTLEV
jgi:hypothetical protein